MATRPILTAKKPVTSVLASRPVARPTVAPAVARPPVPARPTIAARPAPKPAPVVSRPAAVPKPAPVPRPMTSLLKPTVAPAARPTVTTKPTVTARPTVTTKPTIKPTVTKPAVTKPVVTKPTVTKPVVTKPTVTKPVTSVIKPTVTKPATTTLKPQVLPSKTSQVLAPKTPKSNTALNTVLGAVAGVGANALINKLTGKTPTKPPVTPSVPKIVGPKPAVTSVVKPAVLPKAPVTPKSPVSTGATRPTSGTTLPTTGGTRSVAGGTGAATSTTGVALEGYDKEGNLLPGYAIDPISGDAVYVGSTDTTGGGGDDTVVAEDTTTAGEDLSGLETTPEYYQDDNGNVFDSEGNLVYSMGDAFGDQTGDTSGYYTDEDGNVYDIDGNLISGEDTTQFEDYTQSEDDTSGEDGGNTTDEEPPGEKNGGFINLLYKRGGGVRGYADGNLVSETGQLSNTRINPETGDLYNSLAQNEYGDYYNPAGTNLGFASLSNYGSSQPSVEYFSDGSKVITYSDGSSIMFDDQGDVYSVYGDDDSEAAQNIPTATWNNTVEPTENLSLENVQRQPVASVQAGTSPEASDVNAGRTAMDDGTYMETNESGYQTYYDDQGRWLYTTDPNGALVMAGNPDTGGYVVYNADGSSTTYGSDNQPITTTPGGLNAVAAGAVPGVNAPAQQDQSGILNAIKGALGDGGVGAGAIGALLGNLLSGDSGGGGGVNQGVDMSQLADLQAGSGGSGLTVGGGRDAGGVYVPYEQYAYWNPQAQERLYADLGVSGAEYPQEESADQYFQDDQGNYYDAEGNPLDMGVSEEQPQENYADGGSTHFTYGKAISPSDVLGGMKRGGLSQAHTMHSHHTNPIVQGRIDFRHGSSVNGAGDGQSDDIPAMLADGEYVIDADTVAQLGNGSNKAGAKILDKFREEIRAHKRSAPVNKIPPKSKSALAYLKEAMNG